MKDVTKPVALGWLLTLMIFPALRAQTATEAPADSNATAAKAAPSAQAPADATKKITELVHAGKYAEAQQLTTGLLILFPNDQRLIKAKALIEKLLSPAGPANAAPSSNQPINTVAPAQPVLNTSAESLTGMEKVDYSALIVLARQAQQTTDLPEQTKLLQQFMDQSALFLQKHPSEMLLWQLRAASAISLNDPIAGYEAGQKLLATGAADSNDQNLEQLLGQLKNKGWLDKQEAEKAVKEARYEWLVGAWSNHYFTTHKGAGVFDPGDETFDLAISDSHIEGYEINSNGVRRSSPRFRVTILDSGAPRCELNEQEWRPVLGCQIDSVNRTMRIVFNNPTVKHDKDNFHIWELRK
jgi:hypothetical protein